MWFLHVLISTCLQHMCYFRYGLIYVLISIDLKHMCWISTCFKALWASFLHVFYTCARFLCDFYMCWYQHVLQHMCHFLFGLRTCADIYLIYSTCAGFLCLLQHYVLVFYVFSTRVLDFYVVSACAICFTAHVLLSVQFTCMQFIAHVLFPTWTCLCANVWIFNIFLHVLFSMCYWWCAGF